MGRLTFEAPTSSLVTMASLNLHHGVQIPQQPSVSSSEGNLKNGTHLLSREVGRLSGNTDGCPSPRMEGLEGLSTKVAFWRQGRVYLKGTPNATIASLVPKIMNTAHL